MSPYAAKKHRSFVEAVLREPRTGEATGLRGFATTDDKESLLAGRFTNLLEGRIH